MNKEDSLKKLTKFAIASPTQHTFQFLKIIELQINKIYKILHTKEKTLTKCKTIEHNKLTKEEEKALK